MVWGGIYVGIWDGSSWSGPSSVFDEGWKLPSGTELAPIDGGPAYPTVPVDDPCASVEPGDEAGAVSGLSWEALPRTSRAISPVPAHERSAADVLRSEGLTDPTPSINEVIQIDLEGDGTDEAIIVATNGSEPYFASKAGDHSLIVMRRLEDGNLEEVPLFVNATSDAEAEAAGPAEAAPNLAAVPLAVATLEGVADLNGDGTLEVVIRLRGNSFANVLVYDLVEGLAEPVLDVGCGW